MNIIEVEEHNVCLELLPEKANILDLGCRGFRFTDYFLNLGHNVVSVDIDILPDNNYHCCAISNKDGMCGVQHTNDPQGTHIKEGGEIPMYTIKSFSRKVGVEAWDLIKMDIEGSEIEVLRQCQHPISKQVSIEFHAHCQPEQTKEFLDLILDKLESVYTIYKRDWVRKYGCVENYWSVLLIAK